MANISKIRENFERLEAAMATMPDADIEVALLYPEESLVNYTLDNLSSNEKSELEILVLENKALMVKLEITREFVEQHQIDSYAKFLQKLAFGNM